MNPKMPFWRKDREKKVKESLLFRLGGKLEEASSHTHGTDRSFIHPDDARAILRREDVKDLFVSLPWYEEDDRTYLWQNMSLILCILISMRWMEWGEFKSYFFWPVQGLRSPRYTDQSLPLTGEDFLESVPPGFATRFLEHQYRFMPIFIRENSHSKYSTDHRLPILKTEALRDAEGAQGVVEKVQIEKRFLYYANQSVNHSPQLMACKRITAKTEAGKLNFDTEQRTLERFKSSITTNENIMQSFASFIYGSDFIILSPWADGRDLLMFLTKPDEVLDDYMARSIRFTPDNLLMESYNLACALQFLHFGLVSERGKKLRCAHLDLKPENVLVFFYPEDRATKAPVGRWKISDFGLSKVEEEVTEGRVIPVGKDDQEASKAPGNIARELSFQPATRGAGAFQPPEVQNTGPVKVSTRRDVWSFGCILAMVLAFALGGPEEVKRQTRRRDVSGVDDFFYSRTHRRSRAPGAGPEPMAYNVGAQLKLPLRTWLEEAFRLAGDQHGHWIGLTSNLILELLNVNVTSRPEIFLAVDALNSITLITERLATNRLWGFEDSSRFPEPIVIPPTNSTPNHTGNETPFLGVEGHSPASSASHTSGIHGSPKPDRKRSSASGSIFHRVDPSLSFFQLVAPDKCKGAVVEPFGQTAALWSAEVVKPYDLSSLQVSPDVWSERPLKASDTLDALSIASIYLPKGSKCEKVQLAGQWLALLEQVAPSSFFLRVLSRHGPHQAQYQAHSKFPFSEAPEDFKLSSRGTLAVRFRDRLELHTRSGSAPLTLEKEFSAMAFTLTGEHFCLWERDTREKVHNKPVYNYWTVWSQNANAGAPEFQMYGQTISLQLPPYTPDRATGEVFLAPFSAYARFIACDRQQYVYIVRADLQNERAVQLGRTDNARAGFVLPDDQNFMLVRGSPHERQKAEICLPSSAGQPSVQTKSSGELYKDFDVEEDGAAVLQDERPCFLTLKRSGRLVRKLL